MKRTLKRHQTDQERSRAKLRGVVRVWASLSHATNVTGTPVTRITATNADGIAVEVLIRADIRPVADAALEAGK